MNILCKNWDVAVTVAAFYYIFYLFKKWPAHACLIVNAYLVKKLIIGWNCNTYLIWN